MITEDFCSFEVAKLLKEKGFNEDCYTFYEYDNKELYREERIPCCNSRSDDYAAPTHQMAMKWLREEKRTSIIIEFDLTKRGYCPYVHQLDYDMDWVVKWRVNIPMKYEEAVEAACLYSLKNLI